MIYLHVPFCQRFCTYCGFYSELVRKGADERFVRYADAVCREADSRRNEIERTLDVNTLYIGGGTPSVLPLAVLERILKALPYGPYAECTLEANPEDICTRGADYVRGLLALGVNRISLGIQSFDDGILRWMNRRHTAARAVEAVSLLRAGGCRNLSIDLIFGLSQLSLSRWEETVRKAMDLHPEHISAYQLSVEEGSALEKQVRSGRYPEAEEEDCRAQYELLYRLLGEAGYHHYEVSNFALPGFEAVHNSAYWQRVPYVGLGPAAHSFDGTCRRWNGAEEVGYLSESELLTEEDVRVERLMLGLRTDTGVPDSWIDGADALFASGALVRCADRVRIPEDHFFVSDEIIRALL